MERTQEHRSMIVVDNGRNFEECRCGAKLGEGPIADLVKARRERMSFQAWLDQTTKTIAAAVDEVFGS